MLSPSERRESVSEWKKPEYAPADELVIVAHGRTRLIYSLAKYTHEDGWVTQSSAGVWVQIRVPGLWHSMPAPPDQEGPE